MQLLKKLVSPAPSPSATPEFKGLQGAPVAGEAMKGIDAILAGPQEAPPEERYQEYLRKYQDRHDCTCGALGFQEWAAKDKWSR